MLAKLKTHLIIILLLQILLCFFYGYHKMYNARPYSIHQWRQADCASFAKNYYEEGMDFLNPKIHWQGSNGGKAVSEFPLINYSVAILYKLFGEHEYLYRFTVFTIYSISILFLFTMVFITSNSLLYSYFSTSIILTSPLLAYYSFNFLADVPSLSFAIIGLSFFFIFIKQHKQKQFYLALLFATIATLLKASSATVLLIIGCISVIDLLQFPKYLRFKTPLFYTKTFPIIAFVVSAIIIYTWYHFAFLYNNKNSNGVFLMETLPIWEMKDKVIATARLLISVQFQMFLNKPMICLMLIIFTWLLFNFKSIVSYLQISLIITLITFIAFIILFFKVFDVHDYYLITSIIFPIIILTVFGAYLQSISFNFLNKKIIALCVLILIGNTAYCASITRLRYLNKDVFCKYYPFITNDEKNYSDWMHWNYELTLKPLETITPYLRTLGINRNDKVVSIPDPSFNISLYLMDQKGFTATELQLNNDSMTISNFKLLGAKYLVLIDTALLEKTKLKSILTKRIGRYKHILVYDLDTIK